MKPSPTARRMRLAASCALGTALLAACTSTPLGPAPASPGTPATPTSR